MGGTGGENEGSVHHPYVQDCKWPGLQFPPLCLNLPLVTHERTTSSSTKQIEPTVIHRSTHTSQGLFLSGMTQTQTP